MEWEVAFPRILGDQLSVRPLRIVVGLGWRWISCPQEFVTWFLPALRVEEELREASCKRN